jgi:hypothetical protein
VFDCYPSICGCGWGEKGGIDVCSSSRSPA